MTSGLVYFKKGASSGVDYLKPGNELSIYVHYYIHTLKLQLFHKHSFYLASMINRHSRGDVSTKEYIL